MARSEALKEAQKRYRQKKASEVYKKDLENKIRIVCELRKTTDSDIIQKLETVPSKQGYIKNLIRSDISKNSKIADNK